MKVYPSILSLKSNEINEKINKLKSLVNTIQIDIMDGKFVKRKTPYSPSFIKSLPKNLNYDIHLMVKDPIKIIPTYAKIRNVSEIDFHIESTVSPVETINKIKQYKKKACITLNPETKLDKILPYLNLVDHVQIMSVHPGKGGQEFIHSTIEKIKELRKLNKKITIKVDGGINLSNYKKIKKAGANIIIVGSALFKQKNYKLASSLFTR